MNARPPVIALAPNPVWLHGVAYDAISRQHRLDRRRAPSVTQVIDVRYPYRFAGVDPDVLARKAQLGTAVHRAAEYDAGGVLVEASVPPQARVRLDAWRWFRETRRVEPLLCESVVCSRDVQLDPRRRRPYVGRIDFLCVVDRRIVVLLDLKTGTPQFARLQTIAYLDALYQQYPALIALDVQRWALELTGDGRYRVHVFRDDALDARDFRAALEHAYADPAVDWRPSMPQDEVAFDVPDDDPPPSFEVSFHTGTGFTVPDEPATELVSAPTVGSATIAELVITPDVEAYLATLERAVAPYEAAAQAFAREMATAPVDTPDQVAALGKRSLDAKDQEQRIEALFEPAIRKPRLYLDRAYAVRRRVLESIKTGGDTAARRYTSAKRLLEDADRRAKLAADAAQREQQRIADEAAATERRRLTEQATAAAVHGDVRTAGDLIDQARAVEAAPVAPVDEPPSQAAAAAVKGLGTASIWKGEVIDIYEAVLAAARPHLFREVAAAIESGELTAGGQSVGTTMIATKLRALATELATIPMTVFVGDASELKARATADHDTLQWPGFRFYEDKTPVRRRR